MDLKLSSLHVCASGWFDRKVRQSVNKPRSVLQTNIFPLIKVKVFIFALIVNLS